MLPIILASIVVTLLAAVPASASVLVTRDSANGLRIIDQTGAPDGITILGGGSQDLEIVSDEPLSRSATTSGTCTVPVPIGSRFRMNCQGTTIPALIVSLGNGDDSYFDSRPVAGISGSSGSPTTVSGGSGDDDFNLRHQEMFSPFTIDGGPGIDELSVSMGYDEGILIRDAGAAGIVQMEFNRQIAATDEVEEFRTGSKDDVISGSLVPTTGAPREYNGGNGNDSLIGTPVNDHLTGGYGSDTLLGGGGDDVLFAKAAETVAIPDTRLDCGDGTGDIAIIDLTDPEPTGCETVARSAIGERPHLRIRKPDLRRSGVRVTLRCPAPVKHPCRGRLRLAFGKRTLGAAAAKRYRVPAGSTRRVRIPLSSGQTRSARRGRRVFLRSAEKGDVLGFKTTTVIRRLR